MKLIGERLIGKEIQPVTGSRVMKSQYAHLYLYITGKSASVQNIDLTDRVVVYKHCAKPLLIDDELFYLINMKDVITTV